MHEAVTPTPLNTSHEHRVYQSAVTFTLVVPLVHSLSHVLATDAFVTRLPLLPAESNKQ